MTPSLNANECVTNESNGIPMQCGDALLHPSFEECSNDQYSLQTACLYVSSSNLESFTEAPDQVFFLNFLQLSVHVGFFFIFDKLLLLFAFFCKGLFLAFT